MSTTPPSRSALEWLTPPEISASLERDPRMLFAIGPLEDHGPDLPVGTGVAIAAAVVDAAAERSGILRAPPLPYGVPHRRSTQVAGLAGLRRKTLHRAVNELLAGWEDHGVKEFVLVTAHGSESHLDALLMALTSRARTTVFDLGSIPVDDVVDPTAPRDAERSLLLHLDPGRVRGETNDATYADVVRSGEALFERYTRALLAHLGVNGTT